VPATRMAEELGKRMVLNSVMVGFFTAVTHLLEPDAVRKAVADSVPSSFREINLKAFEKGFEYGSTAQAVTPASLEMDPHLIYSED
jgi:2-oxoglutarate ferredoxin oxidoreductase subunit gamma